MRYIHLNSEVSKEVLVVKEEDNVAFPSANGMIKLAGKDAEGRTSDQIRHGRKKGGRNCHSDLAEQQHAMETKNDIWSMSGNFICRHQVQERKNVPQENSCTTTTETH